MNPAAVRSFMVQNTNVLWYPTLKGEMNMKMTRIVLVVATLFAVSFISVAHAGERFWGVGHSIPSACSEAEQKAREHAKKRNSCYEDCDTSTCAQLPDGSWRCSATAANHRGSCG